MNEYITYCPKRNEEVSKFFACTICVDYDVDCELNRYYKEHKNEINEFVEIFNEISYKMAVEK